MIDRATLDRLIALGRERGELTAGEFAAALPVDSMDVDALVLVMLELEAAGVSVEAGVLGPGVDHPEPLGPDLPSEAAPTPSSVARDAEAGPMPDRPVAEVARTPLASGFSGEGAEADRIVLLSGLTAVLILAIVLVLI